MTPKEYLQNILDDAKQSIKETKHMSERDTVDYMVDRALDPGDSMSATYKYILKKMGATVTDKGIKLPVAMVKSKHKQTSLF